MRFLLLLPTAVGCISIGSRASVRHDNAESNASWERKSAVRQKDFATALAYDDALLKFGGSSPVAVREERKLHFAQWLEIELAKLGPLSDDNAEALFGTLVAFRREARRSAAGDTAPTERQQDLAPLTAERIDKQIPAVAARLWPAVEKAAQRGELPRAVALGQAIIDELEPGHGYDARLQPLKAQVAAAHFALAQEAGELLPGARVLHAKLAAIYGGQPGDLVTPGAALLAETAKNWQVSSPGNCGDSIDWAGTGEDSFEKEHLTFQRAPVVNLATLLGRHGFTPGPGKPMQMNIRFDSCSVVTRDSESEVKVPYKVKQPYRDTVLTGDACGPRETVVYSESDTRIFDDKTVVYGHYSCHWEVNYHSGNRDAGQYTITTGTRTVEKIETVPVSHRVHLMNTTGVIQITFEGKTREEPFALAAQSEDDTASPQTPHRELKRPWNLGEAQVRHRMAVQLLGKVQLLRASLLAERSQVYLEKAKVNLAQNQALAAGHNFYIADQLARVGDSVDPEFLRWMERKYRLLGEVVPLALAGGSLPKLDLAKPYSVKLPQVVIGKRGDEHNRDMRSILKLTLTGGVTTANTTGGSAPIRGGMGSFRISGFPDAGGGFRMSGGSYGTDRRFIDFEFFGGYGFWINYLYLGAIGGIGSDVTPGNQDGLAPSPNSFILPLAGYAHYGLRAAYTFAFPGEIEFMYSKVYRGSSALPRENRGDVCITLSGLAFTLRYTEYLTHGFGLLPVFTARDRTATTLSLLGGVGF